MKVFNLVVILTIILIFLAYLNQKRVEKAPYTAPTIDYNLGKIGAPCSVTRIGSSSENIPSKYVFPECDEGYTCVEGRYKTPLCLAKPGNFCNTLADCDNDSSGCINNICEANKFSKLRQRCTKDEDCAMTRGLTAKVNITNVVCSKIVCRLDVTPVEANPNIRDYFIYTIEDTLTLFGDVAGSTAIKNMTNIGFSDINKGQRASAPNYVPDQEGQYVVNYSREDPSYQTLLGAAQDFICDEFRNICVYKFGYGPCYNDDRNCSASNSNQAQCMAVANTPSEEDYRCFTKAPAGYYERDAYIPIKNGTDYSTYDTIECANGYEYTQKSPNSLGAICDSAAKAPKVPVSICRYTDVNVCPLVQPPAVKNVLPPKVQSECLYSYDLHRWMYDSMLVSVLSGSDGTLGNAISNSVGVCGVPKTNIGERCDYYLNNCKKPHLCIPRHVFPAKTELPQGSTVQLEDGNFAAVDVLKINDVLQGGQTIQEITITSDHPPNYIFTLEEPYIDQNVCMHALDVHYCEEGACQEGTTCVKVGEISTCVPKGGEMTTTSTDGTFNSNSANGLSSFKFNLNTYNGLGNKWLSDLAFSKTLKTYMVLKETKNTICYADSYRGRNLYMISNGSLIRIMDRSPTETIYSQATYTPDKKIIGGGFMNGAYCVAYIWNNGSKEYFCCQILPKGNASGSLISTELTVGEDGISLGMIYFDYDRLRVRFHPTRNVAILMYSRASDTLFVIREADPTGKRLKEFHYISENHIASDFGILDDPNLGEYTYKLTSSEKDNIYIHNVKVASCTQVNMPFHITTPFPSSITVKAENSVTGKSETITSYLCGSLFKSVQDVDSLVFGTENGQNGSGNPEIQNNVSIKCVLGNGVDSGSILTMFYLGQLMKVLYNNGVADYLFEFTLIGIYENTLGNMMLVLEGPTGGDKYKSANAMYELTKNGDWEYVYVVGTSNGNIRGNYNMYVPYDLPMINVNVNDKGEQVGENVSDRLFDYQVKGYNVGGGHKLFGYEYVTSTAAAPGLSSSYDFLTPTLYSSTSYRDLTLHPDLTGFSKKHQGANNLINYNYSIVSNLVAYAPNENMKLLISRSNYGENPRPCDTNSGVYTVCLSLAPPGLLTGTTYTSGPKVKTFKPMKPTDNNAMLPAYAYLPIEEYKIQFDHTEEDLNIKGYESSREISNFRVKGNNYFIIYDLPSGDDYSDVTMMYYPLKIDEQNISSLIKRMGIYYPLKYALRTTEYGNKKNWDGWLVDDDLVVYTMSG